MCRGCPVNSTSAQPTACWKNERQFFVNLPFSSAGSCLAALDVVSCCAQRVAANNKDIKVKRSRPPDSSLLTELGFFGGDRVLPVPAFFPGLFPGFFEGLFP